jgi:hypothetical protein
MNFGGNKTGLILLQIHINRKVKAKKTRKFAAVKRLISPKDTRM